jgi:hypothetical protein
MGVFEYISNIKRGVFEYVISEMGKYPKVFLFCQKGVLEYRLSHWFSGF